MIYEAFMRLGACFDDINASEFPKRYVSGLR
jgi:hypothetical protein